ncbi:MAG: hypothetical protein WAL72_09125 [Streptosporangiaceae bacterium]
MHPVLIQQVARERQLDMLARAQRWQLAHAVTRPAQLASRPGRKWPQDAGRARVWRAVAAIRLPVLAARGRGARQGDGGRRAAAFQRPDQERAGLGV